MNQTIDAIFQAKFELFKILPESERRLHIRANPDLVRNLLGEKNQFGFHYVHVDPFDDHKWAICGMKLIQDESIEGWAVEPIEKGNEAY